MDEFTEAWIAERNRPMTVSQIRAKAQAAFQEAQKFMPTEYGHEGALHVVDDLAKRLGGLSFVGISQTNYKTAKRQGCRSVIKKYMREATAEVAKGSDARHLLGVVDHAARKIGGLKTVSPVLAKEFAALTVESCANNVMLWFRQAHQMRAVGAEEEYIHHMLQYAHKSIEEAGGLDKVRQLTPEAWEAVAGRPYVGRSIQTGKCRGYLAICKK